MGIIKKYSDFMDRLGLGITNLLKAFVNACIKAAEEAEQVNGKPLSHMECTFNTKTDANSKYTAKILAGANAYLQTWNHRPKQVEVNPSDLCMLLKHHMLIANYDSASKGDYKIFGMKVIENIDIYEGEFILK